MCPGTYHPDRDAENLTDFVIVQSSRSIIQTEIAPDAATCPAFQAESFLHENCQIVLDIPLVMTSGNLTSEPQ